MTYFLGSIEDIKKAALRGSDLENFNISLFSMEILVVSGAIVQVAKI